MILPQPPSVFPKGAADTLSGSRMGAEIWESAGLFRIGGRPGRGEIHIFSEISGNRNHGPKDFRKLRSGSVRTGNFSAASIGTA